MHSAFTPLQKEERLAFTVEVLAKDLRSPDGIAVQPGSGDIYISEEDAGCIKRIRDGAARVMINQQTVIHDGTGGHAQAGVPLRSPEGLAFSTNGDLYVVEDYPGGRVLCFTFSEQGNCKRGEVVALPAGVANVAWEGIDVGSGGELLLAGSDMEAALGSRGNGIFSGVVLYRDAGGVWWVVNQRLFASFSAVAFSKSGRQAFYCCEITGEVGWLDLNGRQALGGNSQWVAKAPEGVCPAPDGSILVAQENGQLALLNPMDDKVEPIKVGAKTLETARWDASRGGFLATDDAAGTLLLLRTDHQWNTYCDRMEFAPYHPMYSPTHIPLNCPPFLRKVFKMVGLTFKEGDGSVFKTFRDFTAKVPMIAADAVAVPMHELPPDEDPVTRIQFVVFYPNRIILGEKGAAFPLAAFAAHTQSGKLIRTSALRMTQLNADPVRGRIENAGPTVMYVPQPAAVSVSSLGVASLHFMGLGQTCDYSIVFNPRQPENSYLVVFRPDGSRLRYALQWPDQASEGDEWVVAYKGRGPDQWARLGTGGGK